MDLYNIKTDPIKYGKLLSLEQLTTILKNANKAYYSSKPIITDNPWKHIHFCSELWNIKIVK